MKELSVLGLLQRDVMRQSLLQRDAIVMNA